jgi:hypothetical protein
MLRCCSIVLAATMASMPFTVADARLHIEALGDGFAFHIEGSVEGSPWLLQHSPDGIEWQDLLFLDGDGEGGVAPRVEVPRGILAQPDAPVGMFRAVQLLADDPLLRRLLAERAKWRLSGTGDYGYELRQNSGQISWRGTIAVTGGEVTAFQTLEQWPPDFPLPNLPTIEALFDRVADAIAQKAEVIDVTWDPDFGFPRTCFIDLSLLIADEERGWTVLAFER